MVFSSFRNMVAADGETPSGDGLGKLAVFSGVRQYPSRIKCATLCWHTMIQALDGNKEEVRTE